VDLGRHASGGDLLRAHLAIEVSRLAGLHLPSSVFSDPVDHRREGVKEVKGKLLHALEIVPGGLSICRCVIFLSFSRFAIGFESPCRSSPFIVDTPEDEVVAAPYRLQ
jgi:hypothetical protein